MADSRACVTVPIIEVHGFLFTIQPGGRIRAGMPHPLTIEPLTIIYNALMLGVDVVLLAVLARRPSGFLGAALGAVAFLVGCGLARGIGSDTFEVVQFLCWL